MVLAILSILPPQALACGGFFCNNAEPVEQTGEQIVFAIDGDTVNAQVRVTYQGPAESFAWVVPVPAVPTLAVTSNELFDVLARVTQPVHQLSITRNDCYGSETDSDTDSDSDSDSDADTDTDTTAPTVEVVAAAEVPKLTTFFG